MHSVRRFVFTIFDHTCLKNLYDTSLYYLSLPSNVNFTLQFGSSSERFLMDRPNKKSPRKKESPSMGAQPARIPAMSHATRASIAEEEVKAEKDKYLQMKPKVKRKCYKCVDDFMTLDDIVPWSNYSCTLSPKKKSSVTLESSREGKYTVNEEFNKKISLIRADITKLEIDAIVNAANKSLLGGGGVDGAIHAAAGPFLKRECALLDGCETGEAKITCGYNLPAKYVIHTVGPIGENKERLESAYKNCLKLVQENQLKSVAFPCISTGIYGYPVESASHVALGTIRKWMDREEYSKEVKCVILCVFLKKDVEVYEELLKVYFPRASSDSPEVSASKDETEGAAKDAEKESSTELKAKKGL